MATLPLGADGKINLLQLRRHGARASSTCSAGTPRTTPVRGAPRGMGAQFRLDDRRPVTRSGSTTAARTRPTARPSPSAAATTSTSPTPGGAVAEASASAVKAYAVTVTAADGHRPPACSPPGPGAPSPSRSPSAVDHSQGHRRPQHGRSCPPAHYDAADPDLLAANQTGFRVLDAGQRHACTCIVDLAGYYVAERAPAGMRFTPLASADAPVRILDTRKGTGLSGPFLGPARRAPSTPRA